MKSRLMVFTLILMSLKSTCTLAQPALPDTLSGTLGHRTWISAGLGPAAFAKWAAFGGRASLSHSAERFLVMARTSFAISNDGDGHEAWGMLAGMRTRGPRVFATGALGISRLHWDHSCDIGPSCGDSEGSSLSVGYDVGLHAGKGFAGVALNFFGVGGANYITGLSLSLELGQFAR